MQGSDYTHTYDPERDFDRHYTLATAHRIRERLAPGSSLLELGCATGLMTSVIADGTLTVLGVDRSEEYLRRARARELPGTRFLRGDLDSLDFLDEGRRDRFEHILATNVLHELAHPLAFLSACREWLSPGGLIHLTLQNPKSIHRLCALELGMIDSLSEISARGEQWGTRSLWSAEELEELAAEAGLRCLAREGILLKPLPNAQMGELDERVLEGFIRVAPHFPDHCAMNYLVLSR
jgi:2-polyprenyl-3-methyl-5-hydroxy-6-metoxy-1,4-benzoquinol methylase